MSKYFCITDKNVDYYVAVEVDSSGSFTDSGREKAKQAIRNQKTDVKEFKEFEADTKEELQKKLDSYA